MYCIRRMCRCNPRPRIGRLPGQAGRGAFFRGTESQLPGGRCCGQAGRRGPACRWHRGELLERPARSGCEPLPEVVQLLLAEWERELTGDEEVAVGLR